jgi:hypothetical protein
MKLRSLDDVERRPQGRLGCLFDLIVNGNWQLPRWKPILSNTLPRFLRISQLWAISRRLGSPPTW